MTNDGAQSLSYDATGQQATASLNAITMGYDGDGLRLKKVENGATTYYLRSSVLGQQTVCEINASGAWQRGYIYLGGQLLAIQDVPQNRVLWTHQEPYSKAQRITDSAGAVVSGVEVEPFGLETNRSFDYNSVNNKRKYTTYDRDANGGDEAMFRRYAPKLNRFAQPDPYDGSYDFSDPQSLNRYAYTNGDPVNFVDPTGLNLEHGFCYFVPLADWMWNEYRNPPGHWQCHFWGGGSSVGGGGGGPDPRGGGGGVYNSTKPKKFDPNSQFCKSLLEKIKNIATDIRKRIEEFMKDPQNLPLQVPGGRLRDDAAGHMKIIIDAYENFQNRIDQYTNKCGGPPPGIPPLRSPSQNRRTNPGINRRAVEQTVTATGVAVGAYFVIRTILRFVFPPSNLVPVP